MNKNDAFNELSLQEKLFALVLISLPLSVIASTMAIYIHLFFLFWYAMFISFIVPIEFYWFQIGVINPVIWWLVITYVWTRKSK